MNCSMETGESHILNWICYKTGETDCDTEIFIGWPNALIFFPFIPLLFFWRFYHRNPLMANKNKFIWGLVASAVGSFSIVFTFFYYEAFKYSTIANLMLFSSVNLTVFGFFAQRHSAVRNNETPRFFRPLMDVLTSSFLVYLAFRWSPDVRLFPSCTAFSLIHRLINVVVVIVFCYFGVFSIRNLRNALRTDIFDIMDGNEVVGDLIKKGDIWACRFFSPRFIQPYRPDAVTSV